MSYTFLFRGRLRLGRLAEGSGMTLHIAYLRIGKTKVIDTMAKTSLKGKGKSSVLLNESLHTTLSRHPLNIKRLKYRVRLATQGLGRC